MKIELNLLKIKVNLLKKIRVGSALCEEEISFFPLKVEEGEGANTESENVFWGMAWTELKQLKNSTEKNFGKS